VSDSLRGELEKIDRVLTMVRAWRDEARDEQAKALWTRIYAATVREADTDRALLLLGEVRVHGDDRNGGRGGAGDL